MLIRRLHRKPLCKFLYYIKWPDCNISGCALYVHMCHVVLEIPYVIRSQYNVTRSNKKGPFILFVNKVGSHKMHFIGFHRTYNFVQIPHIFKITMQ